MKFTMQFSGGFNVAINGASQVASGPITMTGIVDTLTADIEPSIYHGEFPLSSATFTGAGFVNVAITTPLSLLTFNVFGPTNFAFQRRGEFNKGVVGWNGAAPAGNFMSNVNDLSTLVQQPYSTTGTSTFWYDGLGANLWVLQGGTTIGANLGSNGPDGIFTIQPIPEPAAAMLVTLGSGLFVSRRKCRSRLHPAV